MLTQALMKKIYIISMLVLLNFHLIAQQSTNQAKNDDSKKGFFSQGIGCGLKLSTNGIGLELSSYLGQSKKFVGRIEGSYLPINYNNYEYSISGYKILVDATMTLGAVGLFFDYHPFKKSSFKITAGANYLILGAAAGLRFKDGITQGDILVTPSQVGTMNINIATNTIAPYLGIGIGRAIPKKRFGVNAELGFMYMTPVTTVTATNMLQPNMANQQAFNNNIAANIFLPRFSLNLVYRISK